MVDERLLTSLRQDVNAWNEWRRANRILVPADAPRVPLLDLRGAELRATNLRGADLRWADLRFARLTGANLSNARLFYANLFQTDLCGADLSEADLTFAHINGADLNEASLRDANLMAANLTGANLRGANLSGARLFRAYLHHADLTEANLTFVNLMWADLSGTDFCKCVLCETLFVDVNLRTAQNLDKSRHDGPSTIDLRTLQQSGPLPLSFLRGCGLPDNVIEYLPSLLNQPIQFYSCFLSHSSKDDEFARRLYADLQDKGVRCWFAPEDLKIGDRIRDTIDRIIRVRDKLLVVLSESSIASQWVEDEVEAALEEERKDPDRRTILFPVRIDDAVLHTDHAWARAIMRTRHIGDFSRWKVHDEYRRNFERLLRDLKPELEREPGREA